MKKLKPTTNVEKDVRRILIFVSDLLDNPKLGQKWMLEPRFGDKNAIEMINEGNLGEVMLEIHKEFFSRSTRNN